MKHNQVKIIFKGVAYNIEHTLGPYREYKKLTGKDLDMAAGISDMAELLYCFVLVAARRNKIEFNASVEEFVDEITPKEIEALTLLLQSVANDLTSTPATKKK